MREGQIKVHSENILPIIKKWLYSDKDIFLRELVSNSCDAIKKYEKLVNIGEAPADDKTPFVNIFVDKEKNQLRIEDCGIGMTEEEVEKYITQVAFSGAEEFVERYKDKTDGDAGIIGHFGLGFYSAFMVSETVEIETLSYTEGAKPVHWKSTGDSSYEIGEGTRETRGTTIILNISEDEKEFLEESRIRELLRKYCAFMQYEIFLNPKTGEEEQKPINNTQPLWLKSPKDCTDEEYESFYHEVFMDFNKPLFWIHLNVNFPFNLKGILYFPKQSNKVELIPGEVKLYSNQVYVADNIKEVIPEFLLLLKGVIDCPDMPLNVSRSFLQNDGDLDKISKHITKKVSDKLHAIFNDEKDNYIKYWEDISPFIKYGCLKDEKFFEMVKDILIFKTINDEYLTLAEYPKDKDGKIFYVSDENLQSQYIRMFRENSMNAVLMTHMIDSHFISMLEYKETETKFTRIDSDVAGALKDEGEVSDSEPLIQKFKDSVGDSELTVKVEKLKSAQTPAVLLLDEYSRRMQDMSSMYGEAFAGMKPQITVVLNAENDIVKSIPDLSEENAKLVCNHIFDLAKISHKPLSAEEMAGFIERSVEILKIATGK